MKALVLPLLAAIFISQLPLGCAGGDGANAGPDSGDFDCDTPGHFVSDSGGPDVSDSAVSDSGACPAHESRAYVAPGCGAAAVPICQGAPDSCGNQTFCGCDDVTFVGGCGTSSKPWAHHGACEDSAPADSGGGG